MIEFRNVSYAYSGNVILDGVNMSLPQGSFHFLTGPSGSGKTTLMKLCYSALSPQEGAIGVFGKDIAGLDRDGVAFLRRNVGVVHQDCQFLDHLDIAENIALPSLVSGRANQKTVMNLNDLIEWVGLTHVRHATPPELSGGERQRAALARALINSPDIILADEPTGNIDWEMSQRLLHLLIELNKLGKTILIATHDMALIRAAKTKVQSRVLRLQQKQIFVAGADL